MKKQHSSVNNFFKNNIFKSKTKWCTKQPPLDLNLKKSCWVIHKEKRTENKNTRKVDNFLVKTRVFIKRLYLAVFIIFTKQNFLLKHPFLYKKFIKKAKFFYKNTGVFIKITPYVVSQNTFLTSDKNG